MMTMDITKLSHAELADEVSQQCSQFGRVREVSILQPPEKPQVAFALVGMSSDNEIDRVVEELGAAKVASLAVIRIEQEEAPLPQAVFSRRLQPDWAALV
jgi:hypothetical protein